VNEAPDMRRTLVKLLGVIVIAAAAPAAAQEETRSRLAAAVTPGAGLTADEVARRARATSFDLSAERAEVEAAQAGVDQALAGYIPRVQVTASYTRLSDLEPGESPFQLPVLLDQTAARAQLTIPVSDFLLRVRPSVRSARAGARAADATAAAAGRRVEADARLLYYGWVRARLSTIVAESSVEQARGHLEDARKQLAAGAASRADVLRVESSLAQAELVLVRARHAAEVAEAQVRQAMHDASPEPYRIGEDVFAASPDPVDLAAATARALGRREELTALDENAAALRGRAQATRAAHYPRIDLFAGAVIANPNQRVFPQEDEFRGSWEAGVQLTWTPTDLPGTSAAARADERRAAALGAQRAAAEDAIRIEVLSAARAVEEAQAAVATTARTVTTAEEAYRVRRALFQNGRATSLELTDAELDLTQARFDAVNARVDLRIARARLARATAGGGEPG
jgi:outer membrane protein